MIPCRWQGVVRDLGLLNRIIPGTSGANSLEKTRTLLRRPWGTGSYPRNIRGPPDAAHRGFEPPTTSFMGAISMSHLHNLYETHIRQSNTDATIYSIAMCQIVMSAKEERYFRTDYHLRYRGNPVFRHAAQVVIDYPSSIATQLKARLHIKGKVP